MNNEPKQVIVVRNDLNMRKGKMVAQGAHASVGAFLSAGSLNFVDPRSGNKNVSTFSLWMRGALEQWLQGRFTKICVKCDSEEQLLALAQQAKEAGLIHFLCKDAGITEFNGVPTYTTLAIGPAYADEVDAITGNLKLL